MGSLALTLGLSFSLLASAAARPELVVLSSGDASLPCPAHEALAAALRKHDVPVQPRETEKRGAWHAALIRTASGFRLRLRRPDGSVALVRDFALAASACPEVGEVASLVIDRYFRELASPRVSDLPTPRPLGARAPHAEAASLPSPRPSSDTARAPGVAADSAPTSTRRSAESRRKQPVPAPKVEPAPPVLAESASNRVLKPASEPARAPVSEPVSKPVTVEPRGPVTPPVTSPVDLPVPPPPVPHSSPRPMDAEALPARREPPFARPRGVSVHLGAGGIALGPALVEPAATLDVALELPHLRLGAFFSAAYPDAGSVVESQVALGSRASLTGLLGLSGAACLEPHRFALCAGGYLAARGMKVHAEGTFLFQRTDAYSVLPELGGLLRGDYLFSRRWSLGLEAMAGAVLGTQAFRIEGLTDPIDSSPAFDVSLTLDAGFHF